MGGSSAFWVAIAVSVVLTLFVQYVDTGGGGGGGDGREMVRLSLYESEYLELLTGNPGKYVRFRIDFRLNDSYLYAEPRDYSRTYAAWTDPDTLRRCGSDVLYFGSHALRLPLVFEQPEEDYVSSLYHSVHHQGVLGFGEASPLWDHWQTFTISSSSITFGAFDARDVMHGTSLIAAIRDGKSMQTTVAGKRYELKLDPASEYSLLPPALYEYTRFEATLERQQYKECIETCSGVYSVKPDVLCSVGNRHRHRHGRERDEVGDKDDNNIIAVNMDDFATFTSIGHNLYHMLDVNRESIDTIVLGRAYVDRLVMFRDVQQGVSAFYDSFTHFDATGYDDFNMFLSWIIVMAVVTWAICVHGDTDMTSERVRVFFFVVQVYGLIIVAASGLYNFVGIDCMRLFVRHMHSFHPYYGDVWFVWFVLVYVALWVWNVALVLSTTHYGRFVYGFLPGSGWNKYGDITLIRSAAFAMSMLLSLWLSLFGFLDPFYGFLLVMIVAAFIALGQITTLFQSVTRGTPWIILHVALSVISVIFFLCYNILPYLENNLPGHPCHGSIVYFVSLVIVAAALILFVNLEDARLFFRAHLIYNASKKCN